MRTRSDKALDMIGSGLREAWRDIVAAPLPERIRHLIEQLRCADAASTPPQPCLAPWPGPPVPRH
jgi:hypothetical protein